MFDRVANAMNIRDCALSNVLLLPGHSTHNLDIVLVLRPCIPVHTSCPVAQKNTPDEASIQYFNFLENHPCCNIEVFSACTNPANGNLSVPACVHLVCLHRIRRALRSRWAPLPKQRWRTTTEKKMSTNERKDLPMLVTGIWIERMCVTRSAFAVCLAEWTSCHKQDVYKTCRVPSPSKHLPRFDQGWRHSFTSMHARHIWISDSGTWRWH